MVKIVRAGGNRIWPELHQEMLLRGLRRIFVCEPSNHSSRRLLIIVRRAKTHLPSWVGWRMRGAQLKRRDTQPRRCALMSRNRTMYLRILSLASMRDWQNSINEYQPSKP